MDGPYLDTGESFVITTHRIGIGFHRYDMMLTTRHIILIDSSSIRFEPQKIALSEVLSVTAGRIATGEPVITLGFSPEHDRSAAREPMNLLFTQQPGESRKRERDLWIRTLMQQVVAVRQHREDPPDAMDAGSASYSQPKGAPVRGIETALPHKAVILDETPGVELDIIPEEPEPVRIDENLPESVDRSSEVAETDDREGNNAEISRVENPRLETGVPVLTGIPQEEPGTIKNTIGDTGSSDPFSSAILAIQESAEQNPLRQENTDEKVRVALPCYAPAKPETGATAPAPMCPVPDIAAVNPVTGGTKSALPERLCPAQKEEPPSESRSHNDEPKVIQNTTFTQQEESPAVFGGEITSPTESASDDEVTTDNSEIPFNPEPHPNAGSPSPEKSPQIPAPRPNPFPDSTIPIAIVFAILILLTAVIFLSALPSFWTGSPRISPLPSPTITMPPTISGPEAIPALTDGVWVRVQYNGTFIGQVGNPGFLKDVGGSGENVYHITDRNALVQASFEKQDFSGETLFVSVIRNGTVIFTKSVRSPKGSLEFIIDPDSGEFPGGIPSPTSATGLVPGEKYRI